MCCADAKIKLGLAFLCIIEYLIEKVVKTVIGYQNVEQRRSNTGLERFFVS